MMLTQRVTLAPDVLMQDLAGEAVLLNLNNEQYFGLDEIGTRMLEVLQESGSIAEASEVLVEEYDVEIERLKADLLKFVNELLAYELVEVSEGEG
ncbi:PqqD family protein [Spirulina subsalsa]|uniref:PqqD family protein n=1 Tax=Spirulina subsalsa TaxID=54311 RepID=UPI00052558F4|nr:PqqD family protein [Spirulina subsalsa]